MQDKKDRRNDQPPAANPGGKDAAPGGSGLASKVQPGVTAPGRASPGRTEGSLGTRGASSSPER